VAVGSASLQLEVALLAQDFESGRLDGWSADGAAFADQPGEPNRRRRPLGLRGARLIDTYLNFDQATGGLRSMPLAGGLDQVCFLVGGSANATGVQLLVDGAATAVASGLNEDILREACFELGQFAGRRLALQLVDSNPKGHLVVDDIECIAADEPVPCAGYATVR
jgi:hypothetical protein